MRGFERLREDGLDFDRNLALGILCFVVSVGVGWIAARRLSRLAAPRALSESGRPRAPSRLHAEPWLEWAAGACAVAIFFACADALHGARALMPHFPVSPYVAPRTVADTIARSLSAQLNTLLATLFILPIPLLAALVAFVLGRCARRQAVALRQAAAANDLGFEARPGQSALTALASGVLPVWFAGVPLARGVYRFASEYLRGLGGLSRQPSEADRAVFLVEVCARSRHLLASSLPVAFAGLAIGTAIAAAIVWKLAPEPPRAGALARARAFAGSAALLALAAALVALTEPLRQENETPWSRAVPGSAPLLAIPIETPDLHPIEDVPEAPVLLLDEQGMFLDGNQVTTTPLAGDLLARRAEWLKAHPEARFEGQLIFACSPHVAIQRVEDALRIAAQAGYAEAWFAFAHTEKVRRPVIGTLVRRTTDAARALLALPETSPPSSASVIHLAQHPDCASLSTTLVQRRAGGRDVVIRLPAR